MVKNCKLYRNLYDIIHPSISRKNITEYRIKLEEGMSPIRIFYPGKEVELQRILIYLPTSFKKDSFYESLAKEVDSILFLFDVSLENDQNVNQTIRYIVQELEKSFSFSQLCFMVEEEFCSKLDFSLLHSYKKILLFPPSSETWDHSLIISEEDDHGIDFRKEDLARLDLEDGLAEREAIFSMIKSYVLSDVL